MSRLRRRIARVLLNVRRTCTLSEFSGGFGDLGTLLPIITALAINNQISLTSSLVFGGIWNILSGLRFGIPVCVQPMKAIAAIAMAQNLSAGEVSAAGISVGAIVFLLGATGLITWVARVVPPSIVKGLQLGAGLTLCIKAGATVKKLAWGGLDWLWWDNYEWAVLAFLACFAVYRQPRIPLALIMFLIGLALALARIGVAQRRGEENAPDWPTFQPGDFPAPKAPTPSEMLNGFLQAGLGQLPLTTLNSVVALVYLAKDLFPERKPMSTREVAMSVGLMNLIGCFFGSTPYCHGSGGLAGQYRFGARSGTSVCMLGLIKIIVGLVFGSSLTGLLGSFPQSLLGVMLLISGVELACAARTYCRKEASAAEQRDSFTVVITTAGMLLAFSNDGVGFISGLLCHMLLEFQRRRHLAADDDHTVRPDESATHSNPMSVGTHSSQGEPAASNDAAITSAPSTLPEKNSLSKEPAPATHINVYQESY